MVCTSENANVAEETKIDEDALENGREGEQSTIITFAWYHTMMVCFFFLLTVASIEQENDEHESLVSDKKPTLEPYEGKSIGTYTWHCSNKKFKLIL